MSFMKPVAKSQGVLLSIWLANVFLFDNPGRDLRAARGEKREHASVNLLNFG